MQIHIFPQTARDDTLLTSSRVTREEKSGKWSTRDCFYACDFCRIAIIVNVCSDKQKYNISYTISQMLHFSISQCPVIRLLLYKKIKYRIDLLRIKNIWKLMIYVNQKGFFKIGYCLFCRILFDIFIYWKMDQFKIWKNYISSGKRGRFKNWLLFIREINVIR